MSFPIISLWQPYASLVIHGHKQVETRGYPAPTKIVGQRIGIAATKIINGRQREEFAKRSTQRFLKQIEWSEIDLKDYPLGCILGTALLIRSERMTNKLIAATSAKEKAFGWWSVGRYAWFLEAPQRFETPIYTRGGQGIWYYHGEMPSR
jgi:hypothetical protein